MKEISITDIPGVRLGNAQNLAAATGCTVRLCEAEAVAGEGGQRGAACRLQVLARFRRPPAI